MEGPGDKWRTCGAATNLQILLAFVDPESDLGASLLEKVSSPIHEVEEAEVKAWRNALAPSGAWFGPRKFLIRDICSWADERRSSIPRCAATYWRCAK